MTTTGFETNSGTEISELSFFSFGLQADKAASETQAVERETSLKPRMKKPGRSTATDVAVAFVILGAAIMSCFGINSEMAARQFPQLAAVLHLSTPADGAALAGGANAQLKVWVDLKTALYYCPGADSYGRTRGGRYMSQAEARFANFEPAARRLCTAPSSATPEKGDSGHR